MMAVPASTAAMVNACTRLLRGSGYVAFDGETPADPQHAALASEYAHVTAPLRRLGDRYPGEVCLALCAGTEVPDWVRAALPGLPKTLQASASRANTYEGAVLDLVEAGVLRLRLRDDGREVYEHTGADGIVILSGGTDGEDGPTDAAGAVLDDEILHRARALGLNPFRFLAANNSYPFFEQCGGLLKTGPTHTNVMDVRVALVQHRRAEPAAAQDPPASP